MIKVYIFVHYKKSDCMFKRIKAISKSSLEGIVYQIRYLADEKNVSDEALV